VIEVNRRRAWAQQPLRVNGGRSHRHRVMEKIQVTSLAELVMIAERLGILAHGE
jgi:FixJ family two-component response regulator